MKSKKHSGYWPSNIILKKNPDNKEAEETFKLDNQANEVLSNPEKRKKYDELGENWQQYEHKGTPKRENPGEQYYYDDDAHNPFGAGGQADFSDFFEQFFANKARGAGSPTVANGVVYFGSSDYEYKFYALNSLTGVQQWEFLTGGAFRSSACVVSKKGIVYHSGISGDHP